MRSIAISLLASSLLFAAPVPKEKAEKTDAEAILGMWEIENPGYDGVKWEFLSATRAQIHNPGSEVPVEVVYALDSKQNPKHFDWSFPETNKPIPEKVDVVQFPSIYELKDDTLKVTFGFNNVRATKIGDGQTTLLRRVKK